MTKTKPAEAGTAQSQHTPEPWTTDGRMIVQEVDGKSFWAGQPYIADFLVSECYREKGNTKANAYRAVACVNACAGMADPAAELARLRAVNAQLREACEFCVEASGDMDAGRLPDAIEKLESAIAAAEGQTAPDLGEVARLREAVNLAIATLKRIEPAHTHGPFSSIRGTLDALHAALASVAGKGAA